MVKPTADQKRNKKKKEKARAIALVDEQMRKGFRAIEAVSRILFDFSDTDQGIDVARLAALLNDISKEFADPPSQKLNEIFKQPMVESVFETLRQLVELQEVQQSDHLDMEPLGGRFHGLQFSTWKRHTRAHPAQFDAHGKRRVQVDSGPVI